jgi:hypothetical protein
LQTIKLRASFCISSRLGRERMSVSEYVMAFVTIVLGLAVTDLLVSLHRLLRVWRRVQWDWLAPLFALLMLFAALIIWWLCFVRFRDLQSLSILEFLPRLAFLAINVLMIVSALPDEIPEQGVNLRQFYLESRLHIWSLVALGFVLSIAVNIIDQGATRFDSFGPYQNLSMSLLLSMLALSSRRAWVHLISIVGIFGVQVAPFLTWTIHSR